eukprot:3311982-Pyramimonas_sp.AAC.1
MPPSSTTCPAPRWTRIYCCSGTSRAGVFNVHQPVRPPAPALRRLPDKASRRQVPALRARASRAPPGGVGSPPQLLPRLGLGGAAQRR